MIGRDNELALLALRQSRGIAASGRCGGRGGNYGGYLAMAVVRAAEAGDVDAIVAIDPVGPGRLEEIRTLIEGGASLVAVEQGHIAAFLGVRQGHFFGRDFLDLLFVAPRWRRRGIGSALTRAALRNAKTSRVFTSTNQSNSPMRALLRSQGWTAAGALTGLDEGDPEHVFFRDRG